MAGGTGGGAACSGWLSRARTTGITAAGVLITCLQSRSRALTPAWFPRRRAELKEVGLSSAYSGCRGPKRRNSCLRGNNDNDIPPALRRKPHSCVPSAVQRGYVVAQLSDIRLSSKGRALCIHPAFSGTVKR